MSEVDEILLEAKEKLGQNILLCNIIFQDSSFFLKAYVSQEILNWHSLRHSHSAEL
jgi:hypothetical protein